MSIADDILAIDDLERVKLHIPEWKRDVWIRTMTADERDQFENERAKARGPNEESNVAGFRASLAALTVCDESGNRIFSSEHVARLGAKSGRALGRIFNVAAKINGMLKEDIEELTKKSEPSKASV